MPSPICLSTAIYKPRKVVRTAIMETIDVFKSDIVPESRFSSNDNFNFKFEVKNDRFSVPISNMQLSIKVEDFPIYNMSYLTIDIDYALNKNDWHSKIENRLFIRPLIKKNSKRSLFDFKSKMEKWM